MITYEISENAFGEQVISKIDENGKVWAIPNDPANSDYQAYLNKDNPQVEHSTEIPTPDEA